MSKVFIEESTLTAIGDSIRAKTGGTELIAPLDMPSEIDGIETGGGNDPTNEELTFTGDVSNLFQNNKWNWFIEKYGNRISVKDITTGSYAFQNSSNIEDLSMIHFSLSNTGAGGVLGSTFMSCNKLKKLPAATGVVRRYMNNLFNSCYNLTGEEISKFLCGLTPYNDSQYNYYNMFYNCYSVRDLTDVCDWFHNKLLNFPDKSFSTYYSSQFYNCRALDEITNLYVPRTTQATTTNRFSQTFSGCYRVKNIMFQTQEDGSPYKVSWKSQTIDLSGTIGYCPSDYFNDNPYNSGITYDKKVSNDDQYIALKDDPDWYTTYVNYSRYNHDSAVNTINSLPDASAYLATAGGTNTIKFKGATGSSTDGGAINTLTEEEIAVAAAKGWTVTLS